MPSSPYSSWASPVSRSRLSRPLPLRPAPESSLTPSSDADGPFGVAGFEAQQEALGPFLGLGLWSAVLAEVAVEVEVAQFQRAFAVLDELRLGEPRKGESAQRGQGHGTGERGAVHYCCLLVDVAGGV